MTPSESAIEALAGPPPLPPGAEDARRWLWSGLARRVLYGVWDDDLDKRVLNQVGNTRREAWGNLDLSANLFRQVYDAISAQYDAEGYVSHADPIAVEVMTKTLRATGWWSQQQRVERDTLALREHLVRVDVDPVTHLPTYRPVFADRVWAVVRDDAPNQPVALWELRARVIDGREVWCWDVLDTRVPSYRVIRSGDNADVTKAVTGAEGGTWPAEYVDADGRAELPYVWYHAGQTHRLWDAWGNRELVEGTLNLGVYYTFWGHILRTCANPQRWMAGYTTDGVSRGASGEAQLVSDPSAIIVLSPIDGDSAAQGQVGQWEPGADPVEFLAAVKAYEQRLVSFAGVNAADQLRMSGDPRSGYAVSVSRDTQRQLQRRHEPQFRRADLEIIRITALRLGLPSTGWSIGYAGIPLSSEEKAARRADVLERLEAGLLHPIDAYIELNPGTSREAARAALIDIAAARAELLAA